MDTRFFLWSAPKATEKTQKNTTSGMRKGDFLGIRVRKADGQSAPLLGAKTKKIGLRVSVRLMNGGGRLLSRPFSVRTQAG